MIEFYNVTKIYDRDILGLDDVSVRIEKGEFVFIIGPSGAGKSTFIKTVLKEQDVTSGRVVVDGEDITHLRPRRLPKLRRKIGAVFQDFRLLPNKTVYENIAFAMEISGTPYRYIRKQVPMVLSMVGLSGKGGAYPNELSGGEQQRVSIARAMINNPPLLIADEPTGNLDPETSWEIMKILRSINRRGTTVIMVTHEREIVNNMRRRVLAFEGGRLTHDERRGLYEYDD